MASRCPKEGNLSSVFCTFSELLRARIFGIRIDVSNHFIQTTLAAVRVIVGGVDSRRYWIMTVVLLSVFQA